jgi:hypothetical protein
VDLLRGLNAARSSALKSSGCSQEAKWRSPAAYRGDPLAERENVNDFSQGVPLSKLQPPSATGERTTGSLIGLAGIV